MEPGNPLLQARAGRLRQMIAAGTPTVPDTLGSELETNVFLRPGVAEVAAAARRYSGKPLTTALEVFTALREWRNVYKPPVI